MRNYDLRVARLRICPDVPGLPEQYRKDLKKLFQVWTEKNSRNVMRSRYYNGREIVKNLGIAVPESFENIDAVVGWPAKAVDSLAGMSIFDSYVGSDEAMSILDEVVDANDFISKYDGMVPSQLTHSCSAVTVTAGSDGTPVLNCHSAITCAMLWDFQLNRIKCGVTVAETDDNGNPTAYNLYEPECVVYIYESNSGEWLYLILPHSMGRPLMEPFVYNRSLERPFGTSRITREVMSITDNAMRTVLRTEISAEFYTSPQKVLLGTDAVSDDWEQIDEAEPEDDEFDEFGNALDYATSTPSAETGWEYLIGHVITVPVNSNGQIPQLLQITGQSMEPHTSYMRTLAAQFSGATGVPLNELGVVQDNPSSAEAMEVSRKALVREANKLNTANGFSLRNVGRMAIAIALNKPLSALTDEEKDITTHFMDAAQPDLVARADSMAKVSAFADSWLSSSRVMWQKLGFSDEEIDEILALKQQSENEANLMTIFGGGNSGTSN